MASLPQTTSSDDVIIEEVIESMTEEESEPPVAGELLTEVVRDSVSQEDLGE